jgi:hypothetical protein
MKKILIIFLCFATVLLLTACNGGAKTTGTETPQQLTITQNGITSAQISFSWNAINDVSDYNLTSSYISGGNVISGSSVTLPSSATSFVDTNVFPQHTYTYQLQAMKNNEVITSTSISFTTTECPPIGNIELQKNAPNDYYCSWGAVPGANNYKLILSINSGPETTVIQTAPFYEIQEPSGTTIQATIQALKDNYVLTSQSFEAYTN